MGKRTSQASPPSEPRARRQQRTLLGTTVRVLAVVVVLLAVFFLVFGWFYAGEIRNGALNPPSPEPPSFEWEVVASGASVTLEATDATDQAGELGLSGIWWEDGYSQSSGLVSSGEVEGAYQDVRTMLEGAVAPPVGTDVKVDQYFWRGNPLDTIGVEYETIRYNSDIAAFPAWFIPGTSDTWAIIVHGKGGTLDEALRVIPTFQDLGYPILVINYRNDVGQARDPSGYHRWGATEWRDIEAAAEYARDQGAANHVLFGYSYGGAVIASYLTQSQLRNFTVAAILDSPALSFEDTIDFRAKDRTLPLIPIALPQALTDFAKVVSSWRFDIDWDSTNYLEQTSNLHAPMLIFHGTEDISVPIATSEAMARNRPDITTLITTEAGHTRSWNLDPEGYDAAIKDFLSGLD